MGECNAVSAPTQLAAAKSAWRLRIAVTFNVRNGSRAGRLLQGDTLTFVIARSREPFKTLEGSNRVGCND